MRCSFGRFHRKFQTVCTASAQFSHKTKVNSARSAGSLSWPVLPQTKLAPAGTGAFLFRRKSPRNAARRVAGCLLVRGTTDSKGRFVPKLYSKAEASKELRAMLNIGKPSAERDITQLSNEELIASLAQQAKELGVQIDLSYDFGPPKKTDEE